MENNKDFYGIIMAGGIGSRFWPISTEKKPKQFLDILNNGKTLLQQTYKRLSYFIPKENILIISNEIYKDIIKSQIPDILEENILLEPEKKNTAPCIAYSSFKIKKKNPNASLVICPSDHYIRDEEEFSKNIVNCLKEVSKNKDILITLGIKPTRPDTGYGYIQYSKNESLKGNSYIHKVKNFTEKPDSETAKIFIKSNDYIWNAGIFIWSVDAIIKSFSEFLPNIYNIFKNGENVYYKKDEYSYIKENFKKCENISIDFGVMEKSNNVFVLPSNFGWSDLGTWKSLYDLLPKDENKNVIINKDDSFLYNSKNNIIQKNSSKKIILKDLNNFIVIDTDNTLLILPKEEEQSIKQILEDIK